MTFQCHKIRNLWLCHNRVFKEITKIVISNCRSKEEKQGGKNHAYIYILFPSFCCSLQTTAFIYFFLYWETLVLFSHFHFHRSTPLLFFLIVLCYAFFTCLSPMKMLIKKKLNLINFRGIWLWNRFFLFLF